MGGTFRFLLHFFLLVLVIGLFLATLCFATAPYSYRRIDIANEPAMTHATTGERVDLDFASVPFRLKPVLQEAQMDLLRHFTTCMKDARIPFWAVRSTMLAAVRHGRLIPWDDRMSVAILHEELPKLVKLRNRLEQNGRWILRATKHGYIFCNANLTQYPCIEIDLMKQREHEVSVCTPTDELGECSFHDSYLRRREVFATDMVFPLRASKLGSVDVFVPNKAEECLDILYNKGWKSVALWTNWKFISHATSVGYAKRALPSLELF